MTTVGAIARAWPQLCGDAHLSPTGKLLENEAEECFELTDKALDVTRRATIQADIARRLRGICGHLPETEFQSLVEEMTDRQLRGERRANEWLDDSRSFFKAAVGSGDLPAVRVAD